MKFYSIIASELAAKAVTELTPRLCRERAGELAERDGCDRCVDIVLCVTHNQGR